MANKSRIANARELSQPREWFPHSKPRPIWLGSFEKQLLVSKHPADVKPLSRWKSLKIKHGDAKCIWLVVSTPLKNISQLG